MAVLTTATGLVPPFWRVDSRRLGRHGKTLWKSLLAGFVPSIEWGLEDIKGNPGLRLVLKGAASIDRRGLVCSAAGDGAEAALPEYLQIKWPITIVWIGYQLGTPDVNSGAFQFAANNTDSAPFVGIGIGIDGSGHIRAEWNDTSFQSAALSVGYDTTRQVITSSVIWRPTGGSLNTNGVIQKNHLEATGVVGATATAPSYGASAIVNIGNRTGTNRKSNIVTEAAYVFKSAFTEVDPADLLVDPFALVRPEARMRTHARSNAVTISARASVAGMIG